MSYIWFPIVLLALLLIWIAIGYFGSRVEQLKYKVVDSAKEYEIRILEDHLIAETELKGGFQSASGEAFSILAGYIFGNNKKSAKIAMTAPVVGSESEKIAMTAPVIAKESKDEIILFSFVLPSQYTMDTIPAPLDKRVKIREVRNQKIAALRFSGFYSDKKFEAKKELLKSYLKRDGLKYGKMSSVGYNPPWTPPFMRRQEVWAELE